MTQSYELFPSRGQNLKSFSGKAHYTIDDDGTKTLFSYNVPVVKILPDGTIFRLWSGWTYTTGRHIYAFIGMRKNEFEKLEFAPEITAHWA